MIEHEGFGKIDSDKQLLSAVKRSGTNRDAGRFGFVADPDIMDQLRLECSALSPELNTSLTELSIEIIDEVETLFGEFIPEENLEQSAGIVDRLLCVTPETYEVFTSSWYPSQLPEEKEVSSGIFHRGQGRMIVFRHPMQVFESANQSLTDAQFERYGGKREVFKKLSMSYFINLLSHEIIHEYHDPVSSSAFEESGTEYYAEAISRSFALPYGHLVGYGELPKAFYAELIETYGTDVHKTFFGSPIDDSVKRSILSEFTPDIAAKLFPPHN